MKHNIENYIVKVLFLRLANNHEYNTLGSRIIRVLPPAPAHFCGISNFMKRRGRVQQDQGHRVGCGRCGERGIGVCTCKAVGSDSTCDGPESVRH